MQRDTTTWADFPSLTVTDDAIYILVDMMYYSNPNQDYAKLRAIKKEDVMADIPGSVNWVDIWDFKKPLQTLQSATILKLIHNLDVSESIYIIGRHVGYPLSDDIFIYDLKNLFTSPEITAHNINISPFYWPPHMIQKDGGEPMQLYGIFYTEMVHRNSKIYAVFAEANNSGSQFSKLHYIEINSVNMSLNSESYISGSNLSYGYGDLLVDDNENVFIVFNKSGTDEYAGVFYSLKLAGENNFINDIPLMEGQGNMNIFCSGGSSPYIRFVDFSDIQFDPSDPSKIWIMSEYIGSDDRWKTRVGKISLEQILSSSGEGDKPVRQFNLEQNYPNPFNPSTTINFTLQEGSFVRIIIYNALGQEIEDLINTEMDPGNHSYQYYNDKLAGGIYYYQLQTSSFVETKKMILLR